MFMVGRNFNGPSRPVQRLCISQCSLRAFSPSAYRNPRLRTSSRSRPATPATQYHEADRALPRAVRSKSMEGVDFLRQPSSKDDFFRQFESPSASVPAPSPKRPTISPVKPGRIIESTQDIWSAQTAYLDIAPATTGSSSYTPDRAIPSFLHISPNSSPSTTFATNFFAASHPTFLYSSAQLRSTPPNSAVPEIAIIGASNVGKSTFLNALVAGLPGQQQQQQLARTSARAGHTRTMNAYGVGPSVSDNPALASRIKKRLRTGSGEEVPKHSLVLVDTPGYGFRSQKEWGDGIIGFLEKRTMLKGVVVLIAAEKDGLGKFDREVLKMVSGLDKGVLVIVTKGDKLAKVAMDKMRKAKKGGQEDARNDLHAATEERLREIEADARKACRVGGSGNRLIPRVYLTAADMQKDKDWPMCHPGRNRGVAGARAAILELAGLAEHQGMRQPAEMDDIVPEKRADMASPEAWSGESIPFDVLEKIYEKQQKK